MKRSLLISTCILSLFSCTKDNKVQTENGSAIIWPLKQGNYWHYSGTASYADGGSRDTADLILHADTSRLVEGNEYLGVDSLYNIISIKKVPRLFSVGLSIRLAFD